MGSKKDDPVDRLVALAQAPGIFVIDLHKDLVFGDELIASTFGTDPKHLRHGMAVAALFALIDPADQQNVRSTIYAEREGLYSQTFRIRTGDGALTAVRCIGYTFFDANGPVKKAGALRVLDSHPTPRRFTMFDLCLTVGQLADEEGDLVTRYMMDVVCEHLRETG